MIPIEFENLIYDKMAEYGMTPPDTGIKVINKNVRFNPETGSTSHGSQKATYYVKVDGNGSGELLCHFIDYSSPLGPFTVFEGKNQNVRKLTEQEIAARNKAARDAEYKVKMKREQGRRRLKGLSSSCSRVEFHPYLSQKKFDKEEQSQLDIAVSPSGALLLPIRSSKTGKTINCQIIYSTDPLYFSTEKSPYKRSENHPYPVEQKIKFNQKFEKRFVKDCVKKDGYYLIDGKSGNKPIEKGFEEDGIVGIVEGYATGLEVHLLVGIPVIVCFGGGNMKNVVKNLIHEKKIRPENLLVFADNDAFNAIVRPKLGNAGLIVAKEIKHIFNVDYVFPSLSDVSLEAMKRISDFNDMRVEFGVESLKTNLYGQIDKIFEDRIIRENESIRKDFTNDAPHAYQFYMDGMRS